MRNRTYGVVGGSGLYPATYPMVLKNFFNNQRYMRITTEHLNRLAEQYCDGDATELYSIFDNDNTCLKAGHYLTAMHHLNLQIQQLEEQIKAQELKNDLTCHRYLPRLYSMKGCGFILGSIIATEIVNINRFRTEKILFRIAGYPLPYACPMRTRKAMVIVKTVTLI